jgi:hypothetical protein
MKIRDLYPAGARFRVVHDANIDGMRPIGPNAHTGWRKRLIPGDVLTCDGYGPGFGSDPGYGVHWCACNGEPCVMGEFYPSAGGPFAYQPKPGFVAMMPPDSAAVALCQTGEYYLARLVEFRAIAADEPAKLARADAILSEHFTTLQDAAKEALWVLYDGEPVNDHGGFMLIGTDPEALARECVEHLELEG